MELQSIKVNGVDGPTTLHELLVEHDRGLVSYGSFECLESGNVRIWMRVGPGYLRPTRHYFPGPISAIRALAQGWV